jgi:TolB-like protein
VTAQHENVRLAVLPFETDAGNRALTDGLLNNTSDQLRRVKGTRTKQLTVISLADAVQSKVDRPEKASKLLGATHILTGTLRWDKGRALVHATLADAKARLPLKEWDADYQPNRLRDMPVALAAMVTGTFRFPPLAVAATVSPHAYTD